MVGQNGGYLKTTFFIFFLDFWVDNVQMLRFKSKGPQKRPSESDSVLQIKAFGDSTPLLKNVGSTLVGINKRKPQGRRNNCFQCPLGGLLCATLGSAKPSHFSPQNGPGEKAHLRGLLFYLKKVVFFNAPFLRPFSA